MTEPATTQAGSSTSSGGAGSATTGAPPNKTVKMQLVRLARFRCACTDNHPHPWLPELGLIWRPTPKPPAQPQGTQPGQDAGASAAESGDAGEALSNEFQISITDDEGYITGEASEEDVKKKKWVNPLEEGVEYQFHFVRYPSHEKLKKIAEEIKAGDQRYQVTAIVADIEDTNPNPKKKVDELVFRVPTDVAKFWPKGSRFFGEWILYKDMPHAHCEPVRKQVIELQKMLGCLRYVVGEESSPYRPLPPNSSKAASRPMEVEGNFSAYVMNGVLGFQRAARDGHAFKLDGGASLHADWLVAAPRSDAEEEFAEKYRHGNDHPADPIPGIVDDAVVDVHTGDAIKTWWDSGYRRRGKILVVGEGPDYWLREEGADALRKWRDSAREHGMLRDLKIRLFHTYRGAEVDVTGAGFGRAQFSIHKTALAMDLASIGFQGQVPQFPVYRVRKDEKVGKKTRTGWILYVPAKKMDGKPAELYKESIDAFKWVGGSEHGGTTFKPELPPGQAFLDLTALAEAAGLTGIRAFEEHWFAIVAEEIKPGTPETFAKLISRLDRHQKWASNLPFYKVTSATIVEKIARLLEWNQSLPPGDPLYITHDNVKAEVQRLKWWDVLAKGLDPSPMVEFVPAGRKDKDYKTKQAFVANLRGLKKSARHPLILDKGDGSPPETVTDPGNFFPKDAPFRVTPKLEVLALEDNQYFLFPQIDGEAIGQEWWHLELENRGKGWAGLMQDLGWTKEGLMKIEEQALHGRSGIGYIPEQVAKADPGWTPT